MATTDSDKHRPEVAAGMAAARARGVRLGRPAAAVPPSAERAAQLRGEGQSLAGIAATLTAEGVPTPSGGDTWGKSSVKYVLDRWDQQQSSA